MAAAASVVLSSAEESTPSSSNPYARFTECIKGTCSIVEEMAPLSIDMEHPFHCGVFDFDPQLLDASREADLKKWFETQHDQFKRNAEIVDELRGSHPGIAELIRMRDEIKAMPEYEHQNKHMIMFVNSVRFLFQNHANVIRYLKRWYAELQHRPTRKRSRLTFELVQIIIDASHHSRMDHGIWRRINEMLAKRKMYLSERLRETKALLRSSGPDESVYDIIEEKLKRVFTQDQIEAIKEDVRSRTLDEMTYHHLVGELSESFSDDEVEQIRENFKNHHHDDLMDRLGGMYDVTRMVEIGRIMRTSSYDDYVDEPMNTLMYEHFTDEEIAEIKRISFTKKKDDHMRELLLREQALLLRESRESYTFYSYSSVFLEGCPAVPLVDKLTQISAQFNELLSSLGKSSGLEFEHDCLKMWNAIDKSHFVGRIDNKGIRAFMFQRLDKVKSDMDGFAFRLSFDTVQGYPLMIVDNIFECKFSNVNVTSDVGKLRRLIHYILEMEEVIYFSRDAEGLYTVASVMAPYGDDIECVMTRDSFRHWLTEPEVLERYSENPDEVVEEILTTKVKYFIGVREKTSKIRFPFVSIHQYKSIIDKTMTYAQIRTILHDFMKENFECLSTLAKMSYNGNILGVVRPETPNTVEGIMKCPHTF